MSIFDQWNNSIDTEGLAKDVKEVEKNGGKDGEYPEVPVGSYEIKVESLELKPSSKGDPMVKGQFRILNGEYKNYMLFMNSVINQGFQIANVNSFLRSLETGHEIEFKNYGEYNELLLDVMETIDEEGLEYLVDFRKNKSGFPKYVIKEVYQD